MSTCNSQWKRKGRTTPTAEPSLSTVADKILIGWRRPKTRPTNPVGFGAPHEAPIEDAMSRDPLFLEGDGHLLTIAPTGAGKGVGCIIPTLLTYAGPAIVVDVKGENAAVTARARREMGQEVIVLDVAGATGLDAASLNPLDVIDPRCASGVDNAAAIAAALLPNNIDSDRNRFWISRGRQLLIAVILHVVTDLPPDQRNLAKVREIINELSSDPTGVGQRLSRSRHPEARLIEGNLKISAQETLGGIIAFAQEGIDFIRGPQVARAMATTSFDLAKVVRGDPLTIYIVIPPHLLESLGRVLRLWIGVLLGLVMQRRSRPKYSTLFLLDEAAQLGELPELRTAITLLRGLGVRTWSFWQDLSQIQLLNPRDWKSIVNNCKAIQSFGPANLRAAEEISELLGHDAPIEFLHNDNDAMLLQVAGQTAEYATRPNYLLDVAFEGLYDDNAFFDRRKDPMPANLILEGYLDDPLTPTKLMADAPRSRPLLFPRDCNLVDTAILASIGFGVTFEASSAP